MELLAATTNGRKDKNDTLLQELVTAKNWKQALANCEKRFKKGEKSDGFLVCSVFNTLVESILTNFSIYRSIRLIYFSPSQMRNTRNKALNASPL